MNDIRWWDFELQDLNIAEAYIHNFHIQGFLTLEFIISSVHTDLIAPESKVSNEVIE